MHLSEASKTLAQSVDLEPLIDMIDAAAA